MDALGLVKNPQYIPPPLDLLCDLKQEFRLFCAFLFWSRRIREPKSRLKRQK